MQMKTVVVPCRFCDHECPMEVSTDAGGFPRKLRPLRAKEGFWCPTGMNALEILHHPQRLRQPMKRAGEKGEGKWQPVGWEEALEAMAARFSAALQEHGAESLLTIGGFNKPFSALMQGRFSNVLGIVNRAAAGNMCHFARSQSAVDTFGFPVKNQARPETKTIFLWGYHPRSTLRWDDCSLQTALKNGTKLVLVDPRAGRYGAQASIWLALRPGADLALALGMLRVIFENGWQDKELLSRHAAGLETLLAQIEPYTLQYTAALTGLAPAQIEEATRLLACEKPGIIWAGNALDHNTDGYQKGQAIAALLAVTGKIDVVGGALPPPLADGKNPFTTRALTLAERFTPAMKARRLGASGAVHPAFSGVSGQAVVASLLEGGPLKAAYVAGGNPAVMWADPEATAQALKKLDFMVVADYFLTPTAQLADLVLPVASYLETESVAVAPDGSVHYSPRLSGPPWAKSDMEILNSLANAMGYQAAFWPDMEAFWDEFLLPYGITLAELKKVGSLPAGQAVQKPGPRQLRETGFPTKDGKLHLALTLEALQNETPPEPLPGQGWPYLCTCHKDASFFHSAGRQVPAQRKKQPGPVAFLGEELAHTLGLLEGDWVRVSTEEGWAEQQVKLEKGMAGGTIALASGWWYPEEGLGPLVQTANVNRLSSRHKKQGHSIPAFSCRGLPCQIEKIPPKTICTREATR